MLMLATKLLQLWWYHQPNGHLVLVSKNWPILALLSVENRPSCRWLMLWGGRRLVDITDDL
eukprot:15336164-Ditylum_brightwellii.AAC.1